MCVPAFTQGVSYRGKEPKGHLREPQHLSSGGREACEDIRGRREESEMEG